MLSEMIRDPAGAERRAVGCRVAGRSCRRVDPTGAIRAATRREVGLRCQAELRPSRPQAATRHAEPSCIHRHRTQRPGERRVGPHRSGRERGPSASAL